MSASAFRLLELKACCTTPAPGGLTEGPMERFWEKVVVNKLMAVVVRGLSWSNLRTTDKRTLSSTVNHILIHSEMLTASP